MKFKIACMICVSALGVVGGENIPADELNRAGLELLAICGATNRAKPVLISPFSVDSAFALLWLGSSEQVQAEVSRVLGFTSGVEGLARANRMMSEVQEPRIITSNSLWVDKRFPLADSYLAKVDRYFPSAVFDFDNTRPEAAANKINAYVARNTQNMIRGLLAPDNIEPYKSETDGGTGLILLNTLYFKGRWLEPFDKERTIKKYEFNSLDGQATYVEMMCDKRKALYGETPEYQVLSLPYEGSGGVYTFVAVLPRPRLDVESLITVLSAKNAFAEMLSACSQRTVMIKLPKLDFEFRTSLKEALAVRGMKSPFKSSFSSFVAITEGKDGIYADKVSEVIHATRIKMDEEATEAAAATAITMHAVSCCVVREPPVPEFTADHPYLAFIMDNRTGLMLFAGVVRNIGTDQHKGASRNEMEERESDRRAGFTSAVQAFEQEEHVFDDHL